METTRYCNKCGAFIIGKHSVEACAIDKVRIEEMIESGEFMRLMGEMYCVNFAANQPRGDKE